MRFLKLVLIIMVVFTSCKAKKYMIDSNAIAEEMSARKIAKKHVSTSFNKDNLNAKYKVNFNNGKTKQSISVHLKIVKDEVIWLKGTKFISLFKAKITPDKVLFYTALGKKYFEGDFSMLENLLGVEINFNQLQKLFLGHAILDVKKEKHHVEILNNSYVLSPQVQANLFDAFFGINPSHFRLDFQAIVNDLKGKRLDIKYPSYKLLEDEIFPQEINVKAKNGKKLTTIDFTLKTIEFNTDVNTSFSFPKGYKRIIL